MDVIVTNLIKSISQIINIIDDTLANQIPLSSLGNNSSYIYLKSRIADIYEELNEQETMVLYDYLSIELSDEPQMHNYVLSIILKATHDVNIIQRIVDVTISSGLNVFYNTIIEFQLAYEIFVHIKDDDMYNIRKKLHSYNVEKIKQILMMNHTYINYDKRNKDRIVIIADQILSPNHAPSKIILEYCYILERYLNKDVLLIVSPINTTLDDQVSFCEFTYLSYIPELNGNNIISFLDDEAYINDADLNDNFIINYKGISIKGKQVLFENENKEALQKLIDRIHEFNPLFIYNMACINPLADSCSKFTTVVSASMSYGIPISDGQILLNLEKGDNTDLINNNIDMNLYKKQILMHDSLIFFVEPSTRTCLKMEFDIDEKEFVIAVVGNRLKDEITTEFKEFIAEILQIDQRIIFVLIGEYVNYNNEFNDNVFKNRVRNIGYQPHLTNIMGIVDLYLNPPRKGGGISALIALYSGVPIVTLSLGDVASNIGKEFICDDYDEMKEKINKYLYDPEYYESQKTIGINYTHKIINPVEKIKDKIEKIENLIFSMERDEKIEN